MDKKVEKMNKDKWLTARLDGSAPDDETKSFIGLRYELDGCKKRKGRDRRMNKKIWDLYAPIYEKAMRSDRKMYQMMYKRIPKVIRDKDVLEIATGPGLLAKHVAGAAHTMIATDYQMSPYIPCLQAWGYTATLLFC